MNKSFKFLLFVVSWVMLCCNSGEEKKLRFELLSADRTGIDFRNDLQFDRDFNIYKYRNFYNGGGVGIGDFNSDGLQDIYFTGNMVSNRLYFNQGDFQFEDVTERAGVMSQKAWSTGVSVADINGDGRLDIYVCNSGDVKGDDKQNELFINNGDGVFEESAEAYGLADEGYSTHAAFFDYDRDGDLDAYILNNSYQAIGSFNLTKNERSVRDMKGGDKLMRNDNGQFVEVSEEAGIFGSVIGFGLGVTVGDVNRDGWLDLYISNDFFERDYLYVNNGDGTFTEDLVSQFKSISGASMGADMADVNNDGYPEIFVTEMLPKDELRIKTKTTFEDWDRYQKGVKNGYFHQYTRNMFHLNNADNTFSEIGRLSDVHATDWSWGALLADFDNNGFKDIYVANGINQDLTDQDFLKFIANEETMRSIISDEGVDYEKLIEAIPSNKISNYMMANSGHPSGIVYDNKTREWGLGTPSFSNGSAYADLDNDGDLDLVVNNVNMEPFVYRNNSVDLWPNANFLKVSLRGKGKNVFAIGANATVHIGDEIKYVENIPIRGFQSSVGNVLHIGLGGVPKVDSVIVRWTDGSKTKIIAPDINSHITIEQSESKTFLLDNSKQPKTEAFLQELDATAFTNYTHVENTFVDFDRDRLLFTMTSTEGPCICKGDINGDGYEDLYIGGSKDNPGHILLNDARGGYRDFKVPVFNEDRISEDASCVIFDADQDGDMDLYVGSGSSEFPSSSSALADRLYFNQGNMRLTKSQQILPAGIYESTSVVKAFDYDDDEDLDLLVGIRLKPFVYGMPVGVHILNNDGQGNFSKADESIAGELSNLGLVKDVDWVDIENDGDVDIIVIGEWMPISIFENAQGQFRNITTSLGLGQTQGWWNVVESADLDKDGDLDFVIGNHGLNSRFKASQDKPIELFLNDFDQNGQAEQIICLYNGDKSYPFALKHDMEMQMPGLKKQFLKYSDYAGKGLAEIFPEEIMKRTVKMHVNELRTSLLINNGKEKWDLIPLNVGVQVSPIYAIEITDINNDDRKDILLGGNLFEVKPEIGRFDASYGHVLLAKGPREFEPIDVKYSGLKLEGQIRAMETVNIGDEELILTLRNNDKPQIFKKRKHELH